MMTAFRNSVQLAQGFHFTDHLDTPYDIAYGNKKCSGGAVYVSNADGSKRRELLGKDEQRRQLTTCFSPDGTTLYGYDTKLWAMDLQTGAVRTLPPVPHTPAFEHTEALECSPDNRILLLKQSMPPPMVRGSGLVMPSRLCRISTEGTDFRVLYEEAEEAGLHDIACCWEQGFGILRRFKRVYNRGIDELCKLDLNSGQLTTLCQISEWGWTSTLRPDGTKVAWATTENEIHTYSLVDGRERVLPVTGTCPAWSPDGKYIAYMEDQDELCLWDTETGQRQTLVWLLLPNLSCKERGYSYAVKPEWSPDGRLLWFTLTQTWKLPPPRTPSEILGEAKRYLNPVLYNLNPKRTGTFGRYRRHYQAHRKGIVDLSTRQVQISDGFEYGVTWLPRPEDATKA